MKLKAAVILILLAVCYQGKAQDMDYKVRPYYKLRPDGKPGREVLLVMKGQGLSSKTKVEITSGKIKENLDLDFKGAVTDSVFLLLPPDVGVSQDASVNIALRQGQLRINKTIMVPALRHWTVYVYPHSHVDIGYSNTHANVEFIHKLNIDEGIKLAEKTKNYPEGARYLWNPEVMWPVERYMRSASQEKKDILLNAVRNGYLHLDAAYVHVNTSTCNEEEMIQLFRERREIAEATGAPNDVMVQVDVPGMSWGLVPVLAHEGIRYIMLLPNGTRGNQKVTYGLNQRPFWWIGQDGKSRVLFMQPGSYAIGLGKGGTTGRPWFGQLDTAKIPRVVKTDNPRKNFLDEHLFKTLPSLEKAKHPYDIYVVTWSMWDNSLQDADLPDAVASWNKEFAYPKLIIAGAHDILKAFEDKYGKELPEVRGDFTEYWTDNMGVAAKENAMNRNAMEKLLQAETVWSMLRYGKPAPRADFDEAWRYVILGSEHTYASENPLDPFFFDATFNMKKKYFREASERSTGMMDVALAPATDRSLGAMGPVEGPSNGGVAVINTHSWAHGGLVTLNKLQSQKGDKVIDDKGIEVPAQRLSTGELVFIARPVPAFSSSHYRVVPGTCTLNGDVKFENNIIENSLISAVIDKNTGNVVSFTDKASGKNFADGKKQGLNTFFWQPARGKGEAKSDNNITITLKESGPVLTEVLVASQAPGVRSVNRIVRLVQGQPWIEFSNTVDKLPLLDKDGVHFGFNFDIPESTTRIDIPWSVMRVEQDQWPAANRAWMAVQHWVDISNASKGVTWCSLDAALIENGSITANNTGNWDGKGDIWPAKTEPSSTIYSWVMNNHWFTNTPLTQEGPVNFRYRVMPHGSYDAVAANRSGLEQSQPLVPVLCDKNPIDRPLVSTGNEKVFLNVLKSNTDGSMILRLRSVSEKDETVSLEWPLKKPGSVSICNEGEKAGAPVTDGFTVPAMGFVTLRVEW